MDRARLRGEKGLQKLVVAGEREGGTMGVPADEQDMKLVLEGRPSGRGGGLLLGRALLDRRGVEVP